MSCSKIEIVNLKHKTMSENSKYPDSKCQPRSGPHLVQVDSTLNSLRWIRADTILLSGYVKYSKLKHGFV